MAAGTPVVVVVGGGAVVGTVIGGGGAVVVTEVDVVDTAEELVVAMDRAVTFAAPKDRGGPSLGRIPTGVTATADAVPTSATTSTAARTLTRPRRRARPPMKR